MHNKRAMIPVVLLILVVVGGGGWFIWQQTRPVEDATLKGSGTVEAVEVIVSPEMSGRVIEVLVAQGQQIQPGDILFRLDSALLEAQQRQAETALDAAQAGWEVAQTGLAVARAAVDTAQVQYDIELNLALAQEQPIRVTEWTQKIPSQVELPAWYFSSDEARTAAQAELDAARGDLAAEQADYADLIAGLEDSAFLDAEARLAETQASFTIADQLLARANQQSNTALRDAAKNAYDIALSELEAGQQAYADALSSEEAEDVLAGRAALAVAQERVDTARDRVNALLTGIYSLRVQAAAAALAQAQTNVTQAESKIAQAKTAIDQAQAQLELIEVQLSKLVVKAAVSGVVLSRNIEPGEVVQAGAVALRLAQLDRLTITIYLPEDRYGEVDLGEVAQVSVDSFPGQLFEATVMRIADEAEFTPRNVATDEGRRTTVFAVELAVDDPVGLLKPGMPADVSFGE
jgi:HlyD family secretion protein